MIFGGKEHSRRVPCTLVKSVWNIASSFVVFVPSHLVDGYCN